MKHYGIGGIGMASIRASSIYGISEGYGTMSLCCGLALGFRRQSDAHT